MGIILALLYTLSLTNDWEEYVDPAGAFRLSAPAALIHKADTVTTEVGDLIYHTLFHQADKAEGNQVFMFSYCDYPAAAIHSDSTDLLKDFFESTIREAAFSVNGELMYQTDETLDGYPGKYWRVDYKNRSAVIKTKGFLVRNRYYAIQVVATKERHLNPESERFMDSFHLLE